MQRSVIVVLVVALLLAAAPAAAPAALAKSTLTGNALGLLMGGLSVEYETPLPSLNRQTTLAVPVAFWGGRGVHHTTSVVTVGAGVRYYLDGRIHDGVYFGGHASLASVRSGSDSGSGLWLTAVGGYKWILDNGLVLDAGVNLPVHVASSDGLPGFGRAFTDLVRAGVGVTF